jgi:proton glutamate symport protein
VAIIAGVYRLMDMPVTALNVVGNALAPLVIARWEGQLKAPESQSAGRPVAPVFKA